VVVHALENLDELSIGEAFAILRRLKVKAVATAVASFLGGVMVVFAAGIKVGNGPDGQFGATLKYPFTFSIKKPDYIQTKDNTRLLERIYVVRDTKAPELKDQRMFEVRILKEDSLTDELGALTVTEAAEQGTLDALRKYLSASEIFPQALAQKPSGSPISPMGRPDEKFQIDWHGYENNFQFIEQSKGSTYIRQYKDGPVLEYRADSSGRAIPESFKWVIPPDTRSPQPKR
jgi:hypothetical protein